MRSPPSKLYKYRSLSENSLKFTEQIFSRSELYFSPIGSLNDPSEGNYRSNSPGYNYEGIDPSVIEEMSESLCRSTKERAEQITSNVGVLSLSESSSSTLMWSHYADGHRGICLELDTVALEPHFPDIHPVIYSNVAPSVDVFGTPPEMELAKAMCLTKAEEWQYEKEWRVLSPTAGSQQIVGWALTKVILGTRISADDRRRVSEWVANREPRPLLSQVVLKWDGYGVAIRDSR